jgi:hypothetical protein
LSFFDPELLAAIEKMNMQDKKELPAEVTCKISHLQVMFLEQPEKVFWNVFNRAHKLDFIQQLFAA